jgi:hypothetical protein
MRSALREHYPRDARFNKMRKTLLLSMQLQSAIPEIIALFSFPVLPKGFNASTQPPFFFLCLFKPS